MAKRDELDRLTRNRLLQEQALARTIRKYLQLNDETKLTGSRCADKLAERKRLEGILREWSDQALQGGAA